MDKRSTGVVNVKDVKKRMISRQSIEIFLDEFLKFNAS